MTPTDLATLELRRQAEEIAALRAALEASDAETIKYIDAYIFMERDRDQCARERDAYKAERDALAARVAAYEAALGPAWEADEGATAGEWKPIRTIREHIIMCGSVFVATVGDKGAPSVEEDSRLIAAAVNAVRTTKGA